MATPLAFTVQPQQPAPPPAPVSQSKADLMAYLLDNSQRDDLIARPANSVGEAAARATGMGLDAFMANKVAQRKQANTTARNTALADALFPTADGTAPDPKREMVAQLLETGAVDPSVFGPSIAKNLGFGEKSPVLVEDRFDEATGRKTKAISYDGGQTWNGFGGVEAAPATDKWEALTDPAARAAAGIPESDTRPAQRNVATGEVKFPGGATTNINMANERAEDTERGKAVVGVMKAYADDGMAAAELLQNSQRLSGLLSTTETGSSAGLVDFVRRNTGVSLTDDAGPIQAIQAMVDFMAPRMRPPGSGASSDFDARQFLSSLPSLWGNPTGNAIITQTIGGMAQARLANARIAQDYLVGNISAEEAFQQMQAQPDPFAQFKEWQKQSGNVPNGAEGQGGEPVPENAAPTPDGGGNVPVVTNDAEYEALESGTVFKGPDGKIRRKP